MRAKSLPVRRDEMITAGIIGWPVAHSKSPLIHRFWLAKLGLDGDYSRFAVDPDNLGAAIRALPALGIRGVNVTVPHKVAVMAYLDDLDASAVAVGAANTVLIRNGRSVGLNTDCDGFAEPLRDLPLAAMRATIIGAGGAARAALSILDSRGCTSLSIANRSVERARVMVEDAGLHRAVDVAMLDQPLEPVDLLVNASSLGMTGQASVAFDLAVLPPTAIVYDMVYAPLDTPLLIAARARGLRSIDGLAMLIGQAAAAFELFYGAPAPRADDAKLRTLLTA